MATPKSLKSLSNLFKLIWRFLGGYPKLFKARLRYQLKYSELLRSEISSKEHSEIDVRQLENLNLLLVIIKDKMWLYHVIVVTIIVFSCCFICFSRVKTTSISADLYVSAVQMTVANPLISREQDNSLNGRLELTESTAEGLDRLPSKYQMNPFEKSNLKLTEINFPAHTRLIIEQPIYRTLKISASMTDSSKASEGRLTVFTNAGKLKTEDGAFDTVLSLGANISSGAQTFVRKLSEADQFIISMDQVNNFQLKNFRVTDVLFQEFSSNQDDTPPSIIKAVIKFNDAKRDSIVLDEGDFLDMHFTDTIGMKINSKKEGLHVLINGEVDKLFAGAYNGGINNKTMEAKYNKLPRLISTLFFDSALFLSLLGAFITALLPTMFRQRRQI